MSLRSKSAHLSMLNSPSTCLRIADAMELHSGCKLFKGIADAMELHSGCKLFKGFGDDLATT